MIVRFITGKHFSPEVSSRVDIFRNRNHMRKDKSIYTSLERLSQAARNVATSIKEMGEKEIDIIFNGYLPDHSRNLVTSPFTRRKIAVNFQE